MANKYEFQWAYVSSFGGPYSKGEIVELEQEQVDWLLRDSPGCIVEFKEAKKPEADRQVKAAKTRSKKK